MPLRSKGKSPDQERHPGPPGWGVGHGANNPILKKIILFRNLIVETGCRGGQGSPRAVTPTGRQGTTNCVKRPHEHKG
jgi:hypothetical protein